MGAELTSTAYARRRLREGPEIARAGSTSASKTSDPYSLDPDVGSRHAHNRGAFAETPGSLYGSCYHPESNSSGT